ncbi:glycosyltransferase family 4 protein [Pseudomonadales bacterium]|nr:glycosyltransferase family 4 protein [Pseudomonadales bacterium]MDB9868741.1 glycosyltransferase family 4 protein [Pseudomonadales bacterium]
MQKNFKVFAISRFHVFQLAKILKDEGLLRLLVTAYPKFKIAREWPVFVDVSKSYPFYAFLRYVVILLKRFNINILSSKLQESMHNRFAKTTASLISEKDDVVIGLSSFMEESIISAKLCGVISIVEHGSLHISTERDILLKECDKHGYQKFGNWQHLWMIEKMDREFTNADYVFCCSTLAKKTLIDKGVDESKIFSNPLGVDLNKFNQHKNNSGPFKYLHVSNMSPLKGIQYIIEAFKMMSDLDCELWLVGPMPNEIKLQKLINSTPKVIYHGYVSEDELPAIYNQCDVFVHPSLSDGWAMTVLQAMASGVPPIVSDMTGAKEVVNDGSNGWVVPAGDKNSLYNTMLIAYNNKEELISMGNRASAFVNSGYSWDDYGKRLLDILSIIEKKSNS